MDAGSRGVAAEKLGDHRMANFLHSFALLGGMGLLLLILGRVIWGPSGGWVVAGVGIALLLLTPRASPAMVLRLYRARPLGRHELTDLQRATAELGARAGLGTRPRLYYVPTRVMNAFSVGDRSAPAIGITDGLLRNLDRRELVAVLAHEISHIRNGDLRVMGLADVISRITSSLAFIGQILVLINLPLALIGRASWRFGPLLLLVAAPTIMALLQLALSRAREFSADLGAVELTGDPRGLATALQRLERYERGFFSTLFFPGHRNPEPSLLRTHPATVERVARLLDLASAESRQEPRLGGARFLVSPGLPPIDRSPHDRISGLWY